MLDGRVPTPNGVAGFLRKLRQSSSGAPSLTSQSLPHHSPHMYRSHSSWKRPLWPSIKVSYRVTTLISHSKATSDDDLLPTVSGDSWGGRHRWAFAATTTRQATCDSWGVGLCECHRRSSECACAAHASRGSDDGWLGLTFTILDTATTASTHHPPMRTEDPNLMLVGNKHEKILGCPT